MKKYLRITEYAWMGIAILCVCLTAYFFIVGNQDNGVVMMMATLFAGVMYSLRRRFNRHIKRLSEQQQEQKK